MSNITLVAGGGDVSGARSQYISYSRLSANEGERRLLFSDDDDNLRARAATNTLSGGNGRPADGDCFELIISTESKQFDKLGATTDECKENFKESIRAGLKKLFADLNVDNVRYVAGIHLNTLNPHAHVVIHKGVQNAETGEPVILENIPRNWFYKESFENSKLGKYFDGEIARRLVAAPPTMTGTIPDEKVFLPLPEDDNSDRAIKAFESFAERNNVDFNWLEKLREENIVYVNRQGALTFVKRNADSVITGHTNETGWTGKESGGLFFVGDPKSATRFTFVQSPKDLISLLELVSSRDLSENCFISCNGNAVPQEAVELVKEQSLKRSTRVIWAFNLDRQGNQEARSLEDLQTGILTAHDENTPQIEFHRYAPRKQYGKTWKEQLFFRNLPGEIAAQMQSEFVYKKENPVAEELIDEQVNSSFLADVYERVVIEEENGEFIVYQKSPEADNSENRFQTELGRYTWQISDIGSQFVITEIAGEKVSDKTNEAIAVEESEIISRIEDIFTAQMEARYIQELGAEEEAQITAATESQAVELSPQITPQQVGKSSEIFRQEAYDRAKAVTENLGKIPLEQIMSYLGLSLVNRGERVYEDAAGAFRIKIKDVQDGQVWNDRKDGMRGHIGGISLVRHVLDLDFKEAKEWLVSYFGSGYVPPPTPARAEFVERDEPKKDLKLPYEYQKHLPVVTDYLINKRAISSNLINSLVDRGLIYANSFKSAVFLHRDEDHTITGASWRATVGNKRQDVTGSDKNKGWFHIGNLQEAKRFVITEAPIEALSYIDLHPDINLDETVVIAASGNNITAGLRKQIEKQGADGEIVLAFNNDDGGETGILNAKEKLGLFVQFRHKKSYIESRKAEEPYDGYEGKVTVELPNAQDWNDTLKELRFGVKDFNQDEHADVEISVLEESFENQEKSVNELPQEENVITLETIEAENAAEEIISLEAADLNVEEIIEIGSEEINQMIENIEPDFPEKAIKTTNIHLKSEDAALGKFELLFARNPDAAENTGFTGFRITVNGEKGYVIENLPSRSGKEVKIGKMAMQQSLTEIITEIKSKLKFPAVPYEERLAKYDELRFLARSVTEIEIFARKVAGMYELPSTFGVQPEFNASERAVIKEWSDLTSPAKFYTPEDVFTKTYFRNFGKRAVIQDLINHGYVQIERNEKGVIEVRGGNPLLPEALAIYDQSQTEDSFELRVERDQETIVVPVENHLSEIARTINDEVRKLNSDLTVEARRDSENIESYFVIDSAGDELLKISAPNYENEGWEISRQLGDYDAENDGYVELTTVEYGFEIADAVSEILEIPVKSEDKQENVEEPEIVKFRDLGKEELLEFNEKLKTYYYGSLKGEITKFTNPKAADGEIFLGFHFIAENGIVYQEKFSDNPNNAAERAIYQSIKNGAFKIGDVVSFTGQINEQQENRRLKGEGKAAVAVYGTKYDLVLMPNKAVDSISQPEQVETATNAETLVPQAISEPINFQADSETINVQAEINEEIREIEISSENPAIDITESEIENQPVEVVQEEESAPEVKIVDESRFAAITPVGDLEKRIAENVVTLEHFTEKGYGITSSEKSFQVWDGSGYFVDDFQKIDDAIESVGEGFGNFFDVRKNYELRVIPQQHHTYAIYDRVSEGRDEGLSYAEVFAANRSEDFIAPVTEQPVIAENKPVTLEWKPRQVKVEDLYGYGFKGNQAKVFESLTNLSKNSADFLNALDQHFGGELTDEAAQKLENVINAIQNGSYRIGIDANQSGIIETARQFTKQVKSNGQTVVEIIPEKLESELDKTLREFNEILQSDESTAAYVCEVDEDESDRNEFLTLGIRERNTSIPLYTIAPPEYGEEFYLLTELIPVPATNDQPGDVNYEETGRFDTIKETGAAITEGIRKLALSDEADIYIDGQIEEYEEFINTEVDEEFEASIQEHVNQTSDQIAEMLAEPENADLRDEFAIESNKSAEPSINKEKPKATITEVIDENSSAFRTVVIDLNPDRQDITDNLQAETIRIEGAEIAVNQPAQSNISHTINLPEDSTEKIFQVTATDQDHEAGKNYRWTNPQLHHAGNKKRFQWNMAAIELLRKLEDESRYPETAEEKETLALFSGWGSMKGVFNAYTDDSKTWEKERQQAANMLNNEEFAAASNATLNSHFTDGKIVDVAWQIADRLGFSGGRAIEPSVGNGVFIGRIPDFLKDKTKFTAIEKESVAARIARKLYPESKVREEPYEDHIVPSGWYDLAIGNVPFGDYKVFDKIYNHLNPNIHDYFFLKSLDQVRDGGLQILITSSFSMDKTSDRIRDRISKEGILVGALRFPKNTFTKNAGTEVVTDLLLIRKKTSSERQQDVKNSEKFEIAKASYDLALKAISKCETAIKKAKTKPKLAELNYNLGELKAALEPLEKAYKIEYEAYQKTRPDWMKTVTIPDPDGGEPIKINKYFAANPEMVLGKITRTGTMYGEDSITVEGTDDFDERLSRAISLLPENVAKPRTEILDDSILDRIIVDETIRHGAIRIDGGKLFRAEAQSYGGVIFKEDMEATPVQIRRTERLLEILEASRKVINADLAKDSHVAVDEKRRELNLVYDRFVRDFGALHLKKNQELLNGDPDLPRLLAIENYDAKSKKASKSDLFEKPTVRHYEQPTAARDLGDALGIALNEYGRLYLPRVMFLLKQDGEAIENTYLRVQKEFVETGIAFLDPANDEWTMREEYLAGNVRDRLALAKLAAETEPERYATNITELEKVIPVDISFDQIDVELGASWLEKEDVSNFLAYLTGGEPEDFVVAHAEKSGFWAVEYTARGYNHRYKSTTTEIWGTGRCNMIEAIQHLCDGRNIVIKDRDMINGQVTYVTNIEETEAANQKAAEIQDEFKDWIWQNESRRERLVRKYNDLYNSFLPVKYDGSHLTFPGMAQEIDGKPFELRPNQLNAIWRGIREGKGLMGHPVGSGKTYLEIALAMKMKQIGLTNKPMLGFLKKNIKQAVADARKLYPHANILSTDGNFDSKKRKETVSRIATGNYDLVVMTHDHIDMLPMRPETRARHIHEQLAELDEVMAVAKHLNKALDGKSKAEGRLHSRLEKAKENLEVRLKETLGKSKDDAIYFEETGLDFVMIDEFHYYKSLQVITVKTGIKGIPTNYSERAINMYARFMWLQDTQNGRNTFGATGTPITNTMAELYNQQKYFQKQTLEERGIIAFDAWMHLFGRTVSKMEKTATGAYKTVERLCEFTNLPELVAISGQFLDIYLAEEMPELNRPQVDVEIIKSEMTEAQKLYILGLQMRAKDLRYGGEDNMLAISTDARKVSLDPRMVMNGIEDDAEYKVNKLMSQLLAITKMDGIRTQMIFSEMGIHDVVFEDIIKKLVAAGIPRDKIINFSTMTEKESISAVPRLRSGDALFGLGSTKTLGTGVNAQDNLYAIHNLDTHWLPAYDKQRRGRIERNGNRFYDTNESVKSYYYLTEGGFDEIMYSANHRKQEFIDQIMRAKGDPSKVLHRKIQDVDNEEITYAQLAAVASGNPKILVQLELDKEVKALSNQERRHNTSQIRLKGDYAASKRGVADFERMEAKFTADYELWTKETERIGSRAELNRQTNQKAKDEYNDLLDLMKIAVHEDKLAKEDFEKTKTEMKTALDAAQLPENEFEIELGGLRYNNRSDAGEKLSQMVNTHILHDTVIGAYKGFKVIAQVEYRQEVRTLGLVLQSPSNTKYSVNFWTEEGVFRSMEHLSAKLPEYIAEQQKGKNLAEINMAKIEAEIGKPFKYADRLREAKRELSDVEFEISIFSLTPEEQATKIAEREAKMPEIKVLPESFVTAENSGYFEKAKEAVSDAVSIFRNPLPEGRLAKPAEFVNSVYHTEAAELRDQPLSNFWFNMRFANVGKGQLGINPAAYALIQRAYSETDKGGSFDFAGMYNDPETVKSLTEVLRNQAKLNVSYKSVLNEFAEKIDQVAAQRDGTIAFIADERAQTHEGFHADSYVAAAGKTLEARHTRLDQLVEHEAFELAAKDMTREYRTDNPAMQVEELANLFAEAMENKAEDAEMPYNLTREQCESYLDLWFTSFAEANGDMSREKFEELNESAKEIRDVAYNRIAVARNPESPEFARASEELGEISSEDKRRQFFNRLTQSQLKRDITDDVIKRQNVGRTERLPKESIGEQLGEVIVLDEKLKDVESKLEKLNAERQTKVVTIEVEGELVSTSLEKLREERNKIADEALQTKIKTGFFKLNADGKKSEKTLQYDFLKEQQESIDKYQKPIVSKVFSVLNKEIKPLEGEAENTRKTLSVKRAGVDGFIDRKLENNEEIPSPVIKPDTLWALQENAIKRQDLDSFETLEKIHRLSGLPRSPRAAARIAALQVMTGISATNQHHEFSVWADNAKDTTRVRIMVENKEGKLVPSNWDSDRLRDEQRRFEEKAEKNKNRANETRRASFKRLLDPISNKINPISNVQGSLSWLTDPQGTLNAHFNPLEVLRNDPAVQLCRAAVDFVKKQGESRMIEAQAAEVLRDGGKFIKEKEIALEGEIQKQFVSRKAQVSTAEELFSAVSESHLNELKIRTELIGDGANAEMLLPPKEIFLKEELTEVGRASVQFGDAEYLRIYENAVSKPGIAEVLGEGTERVAARVILSHAETAAVAHSAVENVVGFEDSIAGAVELSPTKLLEVERHLEASEVAEAWLNRLDPENIAKPLFTEQELVRLDTLKYGMDTNSVPSVDSLVGTNKIDITPVNLTDKILQSPDYVAEITAQTKPVLNLSEMSQIVKGDALTTVVNQQNAQIPQTTAQPTEIYQPKVKVSEPMTRPDEAKEFWNNIRAQQDQRLGVEKIQNNLTMENEMTEQMAMEATQAAEGAEGIGAVVAVI